MQKMEEDIVDLKDSVKSIVEWMEVISGKLDDLPRGPSVSNNEAGEVLDDPVNGKMVSSSIPYLYKKLNFLRRNIGIRNLSCYFLLVSAALRDRDAG